MKNYILLIMLTSVCYSTNAYERCHNKKDTVLKFKQLDTNNDGFISKNEAIAQPELTRYMEISNTGYGFEQGDINSDNVLDLNEFLLNEEDLPL